MYSLYIRIDNTFDMLVKINLFTDSPGESCYRQGI
jgi:hypothetical protein